MTKEKVTKSPKTVSEQQHLASTHHPRHLFDSFAEMDRVFDRMMGGGFAAPWFRSGLRDSPFAGTAELIGPRVDVIDKDSEVLVRAELPGVDKDDLEVSMTDNTLTLKGKARHAQEKSKGEYFYKETRQEEFCRTLSLPAEVDGAKVKSKYKDGMLELRLPKRETARRHKIDIDVE